MTDARTEARWDHDRDLRKHDFEPLPLSVQIAPLSTAMDIVLLVRGMSNLKVAADLIDSYANMKAASARLERFEAPNV